LFIANDVEDTGVNFDRVSRSRKPHRADDAAAGNKSRDQSVTMPLKNTKTANFQNENHTDRFVSGEPRFSSPSVAFPAISDKIFFILIS